VAISMGERILEVWLPMMDDMSGRMAIFRLDEEQVSPGSS